MQVQITALKDDRLPVLVASHERSGTHFTMNALAKCFDYVSTPWIDLDRPLININYYSPPVLAQTLTRLAGYRPANIVKSHHEFRFFAKIIDDIGRAFHLVYVYRHPADTLASYWRLLNSMAWAEGPKAATALGLATAPPMARLMRYQFNQYETMLDRWANHVRGWLSAAQAGGRIHLVRYEDLDTNYEGEIKRLGERLGLSPARIDRPARDENVITGRVAFEPAPGADNRAAVAELAWRKHPELMARLGYAPDPSQGGGFA